MPVYWLRISLYSFYWCHAPNIAAVSTIINVSYGVWFHKKTSFNYLTYIFKFTIHLLKQNLPNKISIKSNPYISLLINWGLLKFQFYWKYTFYKILLKSKNPKFITYQYHISYPTLKSQNYKHLFLFIKRVKSCNKFEELSI